MQDLYNMQTRFPRLYCFSFDFYQSYQVLQQINVKEVSCNLAACVTVHSKFIDLGFLFLNVCLRMCIVDNIIDFTWKKSICYI